MDPEEAEVRRAAGRIRQSARKIHALDPKQQSQASYPTVIQMNPQRRTRNRNANNKRNSLEECNQRA